MNAQSRSLAAVCMLSCLAGCALQDDDLDELRRLCAKDAGVRVYRTVDADGYYDGEKRSGVLEVLIRSDFDFIEFCEDEPTFKPLLPEPGCGRYTRVVSNSRRCNPKIQEILENSFGEPYASFRKNYCVEFELIDHPSARYFYKADLKSWQSEDTTRRFTRIHIWIEDRETSELLGEYTSYSLGPRSSLGTSKSCYHISDLYQSFTSTKFVARVLR